MVVISFNTKCVYDHLKIIFLINISRRNSCDSESKKTSRYHKAVEDILAYFSFREVAESNLVFQIGQLLFQVAWI